MEFYRSVVILKGCSIFFSLIQSLEILICGPCGWSAYGKKDPASLLSKLSNYSLNAYKLGALIVNFEEDKGVALTHVNG